ncbi:MAG: hypothetical protein HKN21_01075, partial [Candidatus Eisenbacteria bacterium]|nr:hypothetical protein [Candidatus Eisenbacteria bacterium]
MKTRLICLMAICAFAFGCSDDSTSPNSGTPGIVLSSNDLVFNDQVQEQKITIKADGPGTVTWQINGMPEWLEVSPKKVTLRDQSPVDVTFKVDGIDLIADVYNAPLKIQYTKDNETGIDVTFVVGATPLMVVDTQEIDLNEFQDKATFSISNGGNTAFAWEIQTGSDYLEFNPPSGYLDFRTGQQVEVTVHHDEIDAEGGLAEYLSNIRIISDFDQEENIELSAHHYEEVFRQFDHNIVDAEFCSFRNRLIAVSSDPAQIHIINLDTGSSHDVSLPAEPTSVSVAPDRFMAAVGHNGSVTVVDLETRSFQQTYETEKDAFDVVMGPEWWVYVFPNSAAETDRIHCVNVATGEQADHGGSEIVPGTYGYLHPSGKYLYGSRTGTEETFIEKYDIRLGIANYLYDGAEETGETDNGRIWIENGGGDYIYSQSADVYYTSEDTQDDMSFAATFRGLDDVVWVASSVPSNRVALILDKGDVNDEVRFYDREFIIPVGEGYIPEFATDQGEAGTYYQGSAQYVFFTEDGQT